jgi:hypothetical protein
MTTIESGQMIDHDKHWAVLSFRVQIAMKHALHLKPGFTTGSTPQIVRYKMEKNNYKH